MLMHTGPVLKTITPSALPVSILAADVSPDDASNSFMSNKYGETGLESRGSSVDRLGAEHLLAAPVLFALAAAVVLPTVVGEGEEGDLATASFLNRVDGNGLVLAAAGGGAVRRARRGP